MITGAELGKAMLTRALTGGFGNLPIGYLGAGSVTTWKGWIDPSFWYDGALFNRFPGDFGRYLLEHGKFSFSDVHWDSGYTRQYFTITTRTNVDHASALDVASEIEYLMQTSGMVADFQRDRFDVVTNTTVQGQPTPAQPGGSTGATNAGGVITKPLPPAAGGITGAIESIGNSVADALGLNKVNSFFIGAAVGLIALVAISKIAK